MGKAFFVSAPLLVLLFSLDVFPQRYDINYDPGFTYQGARKIIANLEEAGTLHIPIDDAIGSNHRIYTEENISELMDLAADRGPLAKSRALLTQTDQIIKKAKLSDKQKQRLTEKLLLEEDFIAALPARSLLSRARIELKIKNVWIDFLSLKKGTAKITDDVTRSLNALILLYQDRGALNNAAFELTDIILGTAENEFEDNIFSVASAVADSTIISRLKRLKILWTAPCQLYFLAEEIRTV